ncbi:MAG: class I SAM-dependent methyltransferase [Polyangiaceae bacterium]|jgi:hypothetical protein
MSASDIKEVADGEERLLGPRVVEIDDGLLAMPRGARLVILGAGLASRAYRMRELSESVAFEVDHPASQALKIERTVGLVPCTRFDPRWGRFHHVVIADFEGKLTPPAARA